MPVEIEAKMPVDDFGPVRAALQQAGAELAGQTLETNTFFDTRDHALLAKDSGLRLRINRFADGRQSFVVTFKGPLASGSLKTRDELELNVDNPNSAVQLLARIGYEPELAFEKRRESWLIDDCHVELDELPYLGKFVEIEGPSEFACMKLRETLGLASLPLVKRGYISLLSEYVKSKGIIDREITFAKAK